MTDYVASVLGKGEEILYRGHISLASFWPYFLLSAFFLLPGILMFLASLFSKDESSLIASFFFIAIGLIPLVRPTITKLTTELVITNRRIIAKFGFIRRSTIEINLSKIESIRVEQGILGRLANYGDIFIIGTGGSKEPIPRISHPLEFRRRYDEILSNQG